ncbi:Crp/Fnr family transcriptional regulator [Celeribacter indicus]|uniref:Crp/Fnr-family transcriptional regulator n=1 Tax=Celeribacter indicus TaxID=1208324 RepID=A0A0B5E0R8_9RHOB|nr:Crp/Fnr family transcriptional regulator [Celeribacter indicus]AJE48869.1 Crp/Fnr-family transcriptional regulator [Celeribacter indicus]SDW39741.1 cAMP-binding domain of CRP or a regulatory subunit of cAMP-dependent protein kinases [Celeribacter indicus]
MTQDRYPLTHKFLMGRARHHLDDREKGLLEESIVEVQRCPSAHVVLERGDVIERSTLLIDGFIGRVIFENGQRHIVALHVPGDFVDLHAYALKRLDHNVVAIGPVRVGYIPHTRIDELMNTEPHLSRMLWFSTLLDASIHRQWILKLEQLSADGRLAHILAEMWTRLDFVGLAETGGFALPLTQAELADACGATSIHMNRVIRKLREAELADVSRGRVTFLNRESLMNLAGFESSYLYGEGTLKYL